MKKILIALPELNRIGGVAGYYNALLPFLHNIDEFEVSFLEIGNKIGSSRLIYVFTDQLRFLKKVLENSFDLIHINPSVDFKSFIRDGLFVFSAKKTQSPVLVFFRGSVPLYEKKVMGKCRWFFKATFMKADAFIVLDSYSRERLIAWGIHQPVYIETTTVDDSLISKFSIENKIERIKSSTVIRILFLARIERDKGIIETIDAFMCLINNGIDATLSIAGDGGYFKKVKSYISNLNISENKIKLLGPVYGKNKTKVFEEHDIFCLPSYYEGMPNAVLEAMAFGMPVVTTPVGGLKDFFEEQKMGYIIENNNPEDIALSLRKIIDDKNKFIEIAKYNHFYAKKNFLASNVAGRLVSIYKKILKSQDNN